MQLDLGKLSAVELKDLVSAVRDEKDRRGKRKPDSHEPPVWIVPNKAVIKSKSDVA